MQPEKLSVDVLAIIATIVTILGFLYLLFFGQEPLRKVLAKKKSPEAIKSNSEPEIPSHQSTIFHNLPPRGDFVGREKEKQQVHEALKSRSYIVMIDGIGGIGKTSLTLEVLHECLAASQDSHPPGDELQKFAAFIWTSARDRELNLNDVLDTIARTLDYPFITQLSTEEKRHEVVKRLQEKPCLLIVDNFETVTDEELFQFVLNLPEPGKCLITSRTQSLRQARAISLRGMAKEEALLLIKNEGIRLGLNLETLLENEDNFRRFYEATGGAPLAIRWAIGQIKQRGQSIEGVLNSLYGAHGDIFEIIFQRAWSLLTEPAKKTLTIMPVFAASASKAAIEAASDVHHWELDEALGQLVELWLLEASEQLDEAKRRYQLHPLTRFYAQNKLSQTSEIEHQARIRLAEFFESFAKECGGDRWSWERYDEIEVEKDNIFELIEWCFQNEEALAGMKLTKSVTFFMSWRGYLYESLIFGRRAVEVAHHSSNVNDLAWLLTYGIGWREIHGGNRDKGEALIREGLKIYEDQKDSQGIRDALHHLGRALFFKHDFNGARQCYEKGMDLAKSSTDELAIVPFKRELALLAVSEDRLMEAKEVLELLLPILHKRNDLLLAGILGELARVYLKLKEYDTAFKIGCAGLDLAEKIKKRDTIAWISRTLLLTEIERGNYQSALAFAHKALEFFERSGLLPERIEETKTLIHQLQEKLTHSGKGKN